MHRPENCNGKSQYLSSKKNPVGIKITKANASKLGISDAVHQQLANLPDPKESHDSSSDNGEELEDDITTKHNPLPGPNIPVPPVNKTTSGKPGITKINTLKTWMMSQIKHSTMLQSPMHLEWMLMPYGHWSFGITGLIMQHNNKGARARENLQQRALQCSVICV
ncbi:unnamed protein product [Rhizoctonia solani]|uniref:Uncharacterized protein n=1 Tax=Rhizoctonia solani TaxID=456999 RepID=A0A8H3H6X4_9AGAM|nr:unnamed protein product [Rhizoctonia solani]